MNARRRLTAIAGSATAVVAATGLVYALRPMYQHAGVTMPVDLSAAPYRDVGTPLLAYIRELTEDPDTVVNIVMPEIVVRGWARFLHNKRALYIKRLLLFERHVILSSVPYQLFR
ncbi:MAG TPA: hypothetical protein VIL77_14780 [Gaiellaceae bacterium]